MKIKPSFQATEDVLRRRVHQLQFFTTNPVGICLRNQIGPDNAVAVLRCFFPNRRTMLAWLLIEQIKHALTDLRWRWFWTWHRKILGRSKSQIEVILENKLVELGSEEQEEVVIEEGEE